VFNLTERGRKLYRSLIFSSDSRYSLADIDPWLDDRDKQWNRCNRYAAGEVDIPPPLAGKSTLLISRLIYGRNELFIPSELLQGLIPAALIENHLFWFEEKSKTLRGSPKNKAPLHSQFELVVRILRVSESSQATEIFGGWCGVVSRLAGEVKSQSPDGVGHSELFLLNLLHAPQQSCLFRLAR
jgi:hypothetical protein